MKRVYIHIVTFNSEAWVAECLEAIAAQDHKDVIVDITDNASTDRTVEILKGNHGLNVSCRYQVNESNIGFAAAHNQGVARFLSSDCSYLLIVNPDCILFPHTLSLLLADVSKIETENKNAGMFGIKLLRYDSGAIDSTGIIFTPTLRHFDRGAGEVDSGQFEKLEEVEGITGAFLLLNRRCVEGLLSINLQFESDVDKIYPALKKDRSQRALLFDEAFFAFREDAELALRARALGWSCWYVPSSSARHGRSVTPERRDALPPIVNLCSVRNRALLQLVHGNFYGTWQSFFLGVIIRNFIVLAGVVLKEWTSLPAFAQLVRLYTRARERRQRFYNGK